MISHLGEPAERRHRGSAGVIGSVSEGVAGAHGCGSACSVAGASNGSRLPAWKKVDTGTLDLQDILPAHALRRRAINVRQTAWLTQLHGEVPACAAAAVASSAGGAQVRTGGLGVEAVGA